MAVGVLLSTGAAILVFPSGLLLQKSLHALQLGGHVNRAVLLAVGSTTIQIAASVLGFLVRIHLSGGSLVRGTAELRMRLLDASLSEDAIVSREEGSAGPLDSFMSDTERMEAIVDQVLGGLIPGALLGLSGLAFCLWRDAVFGLVTLLCVLPLLIVSPLASRRLSLASWDHRVKQRRVGSRMLALLRVREQLADHGAGPLVVERERSEIDGLAQASAGSLRALAVHSQTQFVGLALAAGAALCTGIWRVERGALTSGDLLVCLFALVPAQTGGRLVAQSIAQAVTMPMYIERIQRVLGNGTMDREEQAIPSVDVADVTDPIREVGLRSVSGGYGGKVLFRDVSLTLLPGDRLFLIGPNGIGKSTLLRILGGRIAPLCGSLIVNGKAVSARAGLLGNHVAIVPQEAGAVEGTVRENLRLFGSDASDLELAMTLAVVDFPVSLERQVGPDGSALSGGQRQRLVLARAILHRPSLLLLDEPSTHLDWPLVDLLDRLHQAVPHAAMVVVTHETSALPLGSTILDLRSYLPGSP